MQHSYIFTTMLNNHFPEDLVFALAREYLDESISTFTCRDTQSDEIPLLAGVRQGDCMSASLFAYVLS